jgi:hypothetical protein
MWTIGEVIERVLDIGNQATNQSGPEAEDERLPRSRGEVLRLIAEAKRRGDRERVIQLRQWAKKLAREGLWP